MISRRPMPLDAGRRCYTLALVLASCLILHWPALAQEASGKSDDAGPLPNSVVEALSAETTPPGTSMVPAVRKNDGPFVMLAQPMAPSVPPVSARPVQAVPRAERFWLAQPSSPPAAAGSPPRKTAMGASFQAIPAAPLRPPVRQFPLDVQQSRYLTNFILNYNKKLPWEVANLLAEAILHQSQQMDIDYRLLASLLAVESSFRSDAVSSSGAIGLGQLKPSTAQWLGIRNPFDPLENILGASRYLKFLISRYNGNLDSALAAYFQGQGHVDRNGVTEVCIGYLQKINAVIQRFQ
jgi:soluble lytic murein transglycosylase-like protein